MLDHDEVDETEREEDNGSLTPELVEEIVSVPALQLVQTEDGFLVDEATGQIHGHIDDRNPHLPFVIDSEEKANWVLKLKSDIEGRIAGLQAQKAALVAQMDAVISRQTRKVAFWDYRFSTDLVRFSRTQLHGKSKTAQYAWGSVAFRNTQGTMVIVTPEEALEYVETFAPELVQVKKSVGVKAVLGAVAKASEQLGEKQEIPGFMKSTGPQENITISTGIMMIEGSKKR